MSTVARYVAVAKLLDERKEKVPAATRVVVREPETKAPAAMVTGVEKHMNKQTSDHEDVFWRSPPPGCRTLHFGAEFGRPNGKRAEGCGRGAEGCGMGANRGMGELFKLVRFE